MKKRTLILLLIVLTILNTCSPIFAISSNLFQGQQAENLDDNKLAINKNSNEETSERGDDDLLLGPVQNKSVNTENQLLVTNLEQVMPNSVSYITYLPVPSVIDSTYFEVNADTRKYIVKYKSKIGKQKAINNIRTQASKSFSWNSSKNFKELKSLDHILINLTNKEYQQYQQDQDVEYIEADHSMTIAEVTYTSDITTWGYDTLNGDALYNRNILGNGINIAIIDTGIDLNNQDLQIIGGASFIGDSYQDDNGHGTKIAGIIGAKVNGVGIKGLAPAARIFALKASDSQGQGSYSQVISAIDWAIANKMNIINISLVGSENSQALQEAINKAWDAGILITASVGNSGDSNIRYPAKYPQSIAVGAINFDLTRSTFSNFGEKIELVAPGSNIYTTDLNNTYTKNSGTSFATAYVTGAAAAIWSAHPDWSAKQVRIALLQSAYSLGDKNHFGYGLIAPLQSVDEKYSRQVTMDVYGTVSGSVYGDNPIQIAILDKTPTDDFISFVGDPVTTSLRIEDRIKDVYIGVFDAFGKKIFSEQRTDGINGVDLSKNAKISYSWTPYSLGAYSIKYAFCFDDPIVGYGCHKSEFWGVTVVTKDLIPPTISTSLPSEAGTVDLPIKVNIYKSEEIQKINVTVKRLDGSNNWTWVDNFTTNSNPFSWTPRNYGYYKFYITAQDLAGNVGASESDAYYVNQSRLESPSLSVSPKSRSINLSWNSVNNATKYTVSLFDRDNKIESVSTSNNFYKFKGLSLQTRYLISVTAIDESGVRQDSFTQQQVVDTTNNSLVILIPGMAASTLDDTRDNERAWSPEPSGITLLAHDFDALALNNTGEPKYPGRVQASDSLIFNADKQTGFYDQIYYNLQNSGYIVKYFPYDFRLDNEETADKLNNFINDALDETGEDQVSLVAHSMGGLVATRYISKYPDANGKVNRLITLGTPYLGAPKFLYTLYTGNFLLNGYNLIDYGLPAQKYDLFSNKILSFYIQPFAINMKSAYELLPTSDYINGGYSYIKKQYGTNTGDGFYYTSKELLNTNDKNKAFLKEADLNKYYVNAALLDNAESFHQRLNIVGTLDSIRTKLYMIIGDDQATIGLVKAKIAVEGGAVDASITDQEPTNGDGTVPIRSATVGNRYNDRAWFTTVAHSDLPNNYNVYKQVGALLNDTTYDDNTYIKRHTIDNQNRYKLLFECPVAPNLYDSNGNHLGLNGDLTEQQIPGSSYYQSDDKKALFVNKGNYSVKLLGTGQGAMIYTLQEFDGNDKIVKTIRFDNVQLTPNTIITSNTDINSNVHLNVDDNGDGIVDRIVQPSVVLNEQQSMDEIAPEITYNISGTSGNSGWFSSDVGLTINALDNDSSVYKVQYTLDGNTYSNYSTPVIFNQDGIYPVQIRAFDKNRNINSNKLDIKIDKTAPSQPTINYTPPGWTNGNATFIIINGTDNTSGVQKSQYKLGSNGTWTDYNSQVTISDEGKTPIYARTIDGAGNISSEASATVYIDKTSPSQPLINLSNNNWSNTDVSFTITDGVDNDSAIQKTQYKIGANGMWNDYSSALTVTFEGQTDIFARTIDNAGNISIEAHTVILIDRTAPTIPSIMASSLDWVNYDITFILSSGTDNLSGIQKYQYKIGDQGEWKDYSSIVSSATEGVSYGIEGITTIYARIVDNAGNIGAETKITILIDKTPPHEPLISLSTTKWTNQDVTFDLYNGADNLSGAQKSQFKIGNEGKWTDYSSPITVSQEGEIPIYARTIDNANNISSESKEIVKIDKTSPNQPSDLLSTPVAGGRWASSYWLHWSGSDNVAVTKYYVYSGENLVGTTIENSFKLNDLSPHTSYSYSIIGEDEAGNLSIPSEVIQFNTDFPNVLVGNHSSYALFPSTNGQILSWGDNSTGQLGDGSTNMESTSIDIVNISSIEAIAAGSDHVVAVKSDNTVWTWGYNGSSQLGDASSTNRLLPVQVIRGLSDIQMVAAGDSHTVALKNDGTVWAWGLNNWGQIGIGTIGIEGAPKQVWYISGVLAVAAGSLHTLALKSDGTVWAWGSNDSGELGNGSKQTAYVPTQISGLSGVKQIYAKGSTNFAIKADGTVWAWGSNNVGQLGNGSTVNVPTPVQIGINNVASIAPGGSHTLAVKNDGTVWAWGSNNVGQIGNGSTINVSTPVQVSGLSGITSAAAAMDG
ncbi:alpha/beta fold hydrolase, partial [Paenibacillus alba]|uniref:alpha/beta fold hydrolase n=1 Tax=Paenibacillus alba TaxID=1197127 RepID=UPI001563EEFB|nr:alpha/beta fold hydrolase [Paenibacillus alba]